MPERKLFFYAGSVKEKEKDVSNLLRNIWWLGPLAALIVWLAVSAASNSGSAAQGATTLFERAQDAKQQQQQAQVAVAVIEDLRMHEITIDLGGIAHGEPSKYPGWQKEYGLVSLYFICRPDPNDPQLNRSWFGWQKPDGTGNAVSWRDSGCLNKYEDKAILGVIRSLQSAKQLAQDVLASA